MNDLYSSSQSIIEKNIFPEGLIQHDCMNANSTWRWEIVSLAQSVSSTTRVINRQFPAPRDSLLSPIGLPLRPVTSITTCIVIHMISCYLQIVQNFLQWQCIKIKLFLDICDFCCSESMCKQAFLIVKGFDWIRSRLW